MVVAKQDVKNHDLVMARISAVLLFMGHALFAVAPTVPVALVGLAVFTFGTGAASLCRAALTRMIHSGSVGQMFGVLAVCEMIGYVVCGVGFGVLYQVGMKLGIRFDGDRDGWWLALPFYVAAVFYFWSGGMLWVVESKYNVGGEADVEKSHPGLSEGSSRSASEAGVLADGG